MTAPSLPRNHILYRVADVMLSGAPALSRRGAIGAIEAEPLVLEAKGTVVLSVSLLDIRQIAAPDGFAYVLDEDGRYPIGSIYVAALAE